MMSLLFYDILLCRSCRPNERVPIGAIFIYWGNITQCKAKPNAIIKLQVSSKPLNTAKRRKQ